MDDDGDMDAWLCTPEGVKWMMDRIEANLTTRARAVLQAEGAKVVPLQIPLQRAAFILASRGDELAAVHLAVVAGFDPSPDKTHAENLFEARFGIALWCAALDAHPGYLRDETWWRKIDPAGPEPEDVIAWFREIHAAMRGIERHLKTEMRKHGWRIEGPGPRAVP
jgi:hypothetical protein